MKVWRVQNYMSNASMDIHISEILKLSPSHTFPFGAIHKFENCLPDLEGVEIVGTRVTVGMECVYFVSFKYRALNGWSETICINRIDLVTSSVCSKPKSKAISRNAQLVLYLANTIQFSLILKYKVSLYMSLSLQWR